MTQTISDQRPGVENPAAPANEAAVEVADLTSISVFEARPDSAATIVEQRKLADAHAALINSILEGGLLSIERLIERGIAPK